MKAEQLITENLNVWSSGVKARSSAGRGSSKKSEIYGVSKLRELVLELAIHGLLTQPDPNDEPTDKLLESISAERLRIEKEGNIRGKKQLPIIESDEKPFKLPGHWKWLRLREIGHDWGQTTPEADFTYIDVSAINKERGSISDPQVLSAKDAPSRARKIIKEGTVIYSTVRPYLLNIAVVDKYPDPPPIASTAFAIIHPFKGISAPYIYHYLRSATFTNYVEACQTGTSYPAINDKQFFSGVIPIPPPEEQQRIVDKVDELMTLCDQLEQEQESNLETHKTLVSTLLSALTSAVADPSQLADAWQRIQSNFDILFTTENSFDQLKKTILQLAVMGKLVPQDEQDETAESALKRISAERENLIKTKALKKRKILSQLPQDELPSILPSSWAWCPLDQLITDMDSGWSPACPPNKSPSNDTWGILKTTAVQVMEFREYENKVLDESKSPRPQYEVRAGDILITRAGPKNRVGISCLVEKTRPLLMISDKIIRFHLVEIGVSERFISLCLNAGHTWNYLEDAKSGMAESQMNISQGKLRAAPIPLAPVREQHRIITKVDELMALCDQLKANIAAAHITQLTLADSLVEQAIQ